ncbi:hypothetical protein GCM10009639_01720 [Kitasatospora putterlickiae]|uniref:Uncharacterized protein n=1 Tax=Kitasatospora putterlickiae TaxID=221725 RepID=A0ABP4I609_9ACTN
MENLKSWPHLAFIDAGTVASIIKAENPDFQPVVVLAGSPVTKDLQSGRVRLFVNVQNLVIEVPREG